MLWGVAVSCSRREARFRIGVSQCSEDEWRRQMRVKKAASLLASSDMTVAEIAYEVGFSSPAYFTKCYKEQFGESPTEFLKRRG